MNQALKTTLFGLFGNSFLFITKLFAGLSSGSLALISDAINSLTDILSSLGIIYAVRISGREADQSHPFGHKRAEPIAGLIVAILAGILSFEILKSAIIGLIHPRTRTFGLLPILILIICIFTKIIMSLYFKRVGERIKSPAILASYVDSRNDVLVSFTALIGVLGGNIGFIDLDYFAAILISLFILYSGYKIGIENIDYLMGKSPDENLINEIKKRALSIPEVLNLNDVRAHYVGNFIHVEIHIEVDKNLTILESHKIGKDVQWGIEKMENVDRAFVHIDPW
ncbi:MAG: cation diffusion facilitator family transporter [Candidatus Methanofastidiosia archaeon]